MEKDNVFRLTCSCGCGDGFEAKAAHGTLYVSFFRSDWYAQQHAFRSAVTDKMKYMKGNRLLREVLVSREDLIAFRDFLKDVKWEDSSDYKNVSHITPMHLLDEINLQRLSTKPFFLAHKVDHSCTSLLAKQLALAKP